MGGGGLKVSGGLTISTSDLVITGGLSITGGFVISSGGPIQAVKVVHTGGMTVTSGSTTAANASFADVAGVKLRVTGGVTISGTIDAQTAQTYSDRRLKKEINQVDVPLDKLMRLRGVYFKWKPDVGPVRDGYTERYDASRTISSYTQMLT